MNNPKLVLWLLRIGIASVFLYAGIAALISPSDWIGFLPVVVTKIIPSKPLMFGFSISQLVLAVWLLIGWKSFWAAVVAAVMIVGIVATNLNSLFITFRDFTIFFAATALAVATYQKK